MYPQAPIHDPVWHLAQTRPDHPVMYFNPAALRAAAERFRRGFPGLVTYAVKANPAPMVLETLAAGGMQAFDVASPAEIEMVQAAAPGAALHYNNPVRSHEEVATGVRAGVVSWSIDSLSELDKLGRPRRPGEEVAVRIALPVKGAHYDFGEKFGETPEGAAAILREVARRGFFPAITFHPGTQCAEPAAWAAYIEAAADVARRAGVTIGRLNVGGGFAAHRAGPAPDLEAIFAAIDSAVARAFDGPAPALLCEPGRAMVADCFVLATRIKAVRECGAIFLNDGLYGALSELRDIGPNHRVRVIGPDGQERRGPIRPRVAFGPTCDSLDRVPDPVPLPGDLEEGDYLLFEGMGAYSLAIATRFNGYGPGEVVTLAPGAA
ncbi:type III PLP-dependent enzyme [Marimonas lutisalis]|uniref:type III PLP-dependent enzyme n=1 Tax=Marimonas lutisalis TaxID=2545756 RepID=UPI0010F918CE|nr:type III PLP-dependent enzyme [Marimonas lutisalis]